ncbi:Uncharacterised protein [Yersinia massiliensis]|nr:Uncharacterised protein [Yersinia massiliensis]
MPIKGRRFSHDIDLPAQPIRQGRGSEIRVAKEISKIETTLTDQTFRIDGEPAPNTGIQNISMMNIAMKNSEVLWGRE